MHQLNCVMSPSFFICFLLIIFFFKIVCKIFFILRILKKKSSIVKLYMENDVYLENVKFVFFFRVGLLQKRTLMQCCGANNLNSTSFISFNLIYEFRDVPIGKCLFLMIFYFVYYFSILSFFFYFFFRKLFFNASFVQCLKRVFRKQQLKALFCIQFASIKF